MTATQYVITINDDQTVDVVHNGEPVMQGKFIHISHNRPIRAIHGATAVLALEPTGEEWFTIRVSKHPCY